VLEVVSFYTNCESFQENYLEVFVPTQRLILNPLARVTLVLLFVFTGVESLIFFSDSGLIPTAEARGKDKDKDDDDDFVFDEDTFTKTINCKKIKILKIDYHEDFVSTENATGPNILVVGASGKSCSITIEKITGGNKCGFRVYIEDMPHVGKVLRVKTKPKGNAKDCEMCIKLEVPRKMHIGVPPSSLF